MHANRTSLLYAAATFVAASLALGCQKAPERKDAPTTASAAPLQAAVAPAAPASVASPEATPSGGSSPYCVGQSRLVANAERCFACEKANCDAPVAAGCESLEADADRARCTAALTCMRSSNCIARGGALACYCGPSVDIVSCKSDATKADGACKAEITAGFPVESTPQFIVDNSTRADLPGALAMAMAQCDFAFCGPKEQAGHSECVPYCKP